MGSSVSFVFPKERALEFFKKTLIDVGAKLTKDVEINSGFGVKVHALFNNEPLAFVLYFNRKTNQSSRIVFEKVPEHLRQQFMLPLNRSTGPLHDTKRAMPVHASIMIQDQQQREAVRKSLNVHNFTITECKVQPHQDYVIQVQENGQTLTITQFSTGKLLIQGIYSSLVDKVVQLVDLIKPLSDEERMLLYVPKENQAGIRDDLARFSQCFDHLLEKGKSELNEAFDFLFENDKKTFMTGLCLIDVFKENKHQLPEYNFLVAQFAKVFEGFIIRMMIQKQFFTLKSYRENPDSAGIGNALRKGKFKKYIKDHRRNDFIIENLLAVWEGSRCKEMHSDPFADENIVRISTFEQAINKIGGIKTCILDAYNIIIKCGLMDDEITEKKDNTPVVGMITKANSCRIGTDESGKGDYLGPLAVAGVCLQSADERKLLDIGVCDSKLLSDAKIIAIADQIRKVLGKTAYNIVYLNPEKYNQLHKTMGNLNRLLGWAHARAIENLLQENDCELAITDQFGDEDYVNRALMKMGKKIRLIQMPKAEQDTAVAAASILARETFLRRLSEMSKQYGITFPKGASPAVEEVARLIIQRHGKDALSKIAKVHFKTTEKVLL